MRNDDYSKPIYGTSEMHYSMSMYSDCHIPHRTWWGKLRLNMALRKAFREHEKLRKLEAKIAKENKHEEKHD